MHPSEIHNKMAKSRVCFKLGKKVKTPPVTFGCSLPTEQPKVCSRIKRNLSRPQAPIVKGALVSSPKNEEDIIVNHAETHMNESFRFFKEKFELVVREAVGESDSRSVEVKNIRKLLKGLVPVAINFGKFLARKKLAVESYKRNAVEKKKTPFPSTLEQNFYQAYDYSELEELAKFLRGVKIGISTSLVDVLKKEDENLKMVRGIKENVIYLGRRLSVLVLKLQLIMNSEGDQEMQARFESFKLLLEVLRDISVRKSPVLENLTNLLAHGQHELHQLLGKLKLKNIYVTTDWSTLRLKRLDNFLDWVAGVIAKVDTLVSLPLLEEMPTRSSLQQVMDLLEYFSDPLEKIEKFLKEELISLFKVNYQLKRSAVIHTDYVNKMKIFLEAPWI